MPIARVLVTVGTIILVVLTVIWGIKYMTCPTPDQRAKLKTQLIGFVVATVVIFGAQFIWSTVYDFMYNLTTK